MRRQAKAPWAGPSRPRLWGSVRRSGVAGLVVAFGIPVLAALATLAMSPVMARAAYVPPYTFSGSITGNATTHQLADVRAVAVDRDTGDLYAADSSRERIVKFDSAGNFLFMFGDGVNQTTGGDICPVDPGDLCKAGVTGSNQGAAPGSFNAMSSIAVDNSGGPSDGSLYVGDEGGKRVSKFDSSGNLITGWGINGQLIGPGGGQPWSPNAGTNTFRGIAVDETSGDLWVYDALRSLNKFNQKGLFERRFATSPAAPMPFGTPSQPAIDLRGRFILLQLAEPRGPVAIDTGTGAVLGLVASAPSGSGGAAINHITGDAVVVHGTEASILAESCEPISGPCTPIDTFGAGSLSNPAGIAVDAGRGRIYVADRTAIRIFNAMVVPDVSVLGAPDYTETTATISAEIDPAGGGPVTQCEIQYGLTDAYGSSLPCDQATPFGDVTQATATITGLATETTYHYRVVAGNANGIGHSPDATVTPHYVAGLSTDPATEVGPGGARLNGTLDPDGEDTHYYFEWGTSESYGNTTSEPPGSDLASGDGAQGASVELGNALRADTTYHYRIVATNNKGTSRGEDRTFTTTAPAAPSVVRAFTSEPTSSSVRLNAEIDSGFGEVAYVFQYGPDSSYGESTGVVGPVGGNGAIRKVASTIDGLSVGTTYHFRVIAINATGTAVSPDQTMTTAGPPSLDSSGVSNVTANGARLTAKVNPGLRDTTVYFEYGPSAAYGAKTQQFHLGGSGATAGEFAVDLSSLSPATEYHFRAVAVNDVGTTFGVGQKFTTSGEITLSARPPIKCKRGRIRKAGKCRKKQRKRRHAQRTRRGGSGNRG